MSPKVAIIILNWNGWEDTLECLESIYLSHYSNYTVFLVDNSSEDNSIDCIRQYCEGKLTVKSPLINYNPHSKPLKLYEYSEDELKPGVYSPDFQEPSRPLEPSGPSLLNKSNNELVLFKNRENHGFAQGNNIAVEFVSNNWNPDYFLLLNNDTVVDPNYLDKLVGASLHGSNVGCVGPKIYYYDYKGRSDILSFTWEKINFYTSRGKRCGKDQEDQGQCDYRRETDKVEGCCMLIKTEVINELGLFDPVYFAYWEETDLCMRIKKAGWKLTYVPEAVIWHKVGMQWDNYFSYFVIYHYLVRNRLIFMWRYATRLQKSVFSIYFLFYLVINIILMLYKEDWQKSKECFKAMKEGVSDFRSLKDS